MTNKFSSLFLSAALLLGCFSCGRHSSIGTSDGDTVREPIDSMAVAAAKIDSVEKNGGEAPPEIKFNSSEEALDFMHKSGHWSEYETGILPRMASENLEYCGKLLNNTKKHFIIVDKASMKVILYDRYGNKKLAYGMDCGSNYGTKHRKADRRTVDGYFTAEGIYDSTDWLYTNDNGYTSPARGQFGPRFIRLKTPVTRSIGIHGTSAPRSIGRRASHGCIRILNQNILELVKYAEKDMPIIVSPSERDKAVNDREGYDIPMVYTGEEPLASSKPSKESDKKKKGVVHKKDSVKNETESTGNSEGTGEKEVKEEKETPAEEKAPVSQ